MDKAILELFNRGVRLRNEGKYQQSIQVFRQVLQDAPETAAAHQNIGAALFSLKKYAQARDEFQQALNIQPNMERASYNAGLALLRLHQLDESIAAFQQEMQHHPSAWLYHDLGLAYLLKKDLGAAQEAFRIALQLDPNIAFTHMHLGHVYVQQEFYEEAIREYRAALRLNPALWNAKRALVYSLLMRGQLLTEIKAWFASKCNGLTH